MASAGESGVAPPADCAYKWVGTWKWGLGTTEVLPNGMAYPRCFLCVPYQRWTCSGDTSTWSNPDGHTWTVRLVPPGDRMVGTGSNSHVTATRIGGPAQPPVSTIPGGQGVPATGAPPARPSAACPSGFQWVGGHLCAAYNVSSSWCASNGGRFVDPDVGGAPTRCEVASTRTADAENRAPLAAGGDPSPTVIAAEPRAPGPSAQVTPPVLPEPSAVVTTSPLPAQTIGSNAAAAGRCDAYFNSMIDGFVSAARQCGISSERLESLIDMAYSPRRTAAGQGIIRTTDHPELFHVIPPGDARWSEANGWVEPNCREPLLIRNQQESFMECYRVYVCGIRAATCAHELTRATQQLTCQAASQQCLATHPVPQRATAR